MITRHRQATRSTVMPAVSQLFRHGSPAGAFLRRAWGVDLDAYPRSFFRFREQDAKELTPADIMHSLRQHPAGQSFDVEVFNGDQPEAIHQHASRFVMKIPALIPNMQVGALQSVHGLASPVTAALPPSDLALCSPQPSLTIFEVAGILNAGAVGERCKGFQPNVNAYGFRALGQRQGIDFDAEADVPTPGFALQGDRFDRTLERAMPFDFEIADTLTVQLAIVADLAAVVVGGEGVGVETGVGFKPRVPSFLTRLHAAEERFEGLIDPPKDILTGRKICQAQTAIGTNRPELVGLIVIVQRDSALFVGITALLQSRVIQKPGPFQLNVENFGLTACGIQPVLIALPHRSGSSLRFDIPLNRGGRDFPSGPDVIRAGPQAGQTAAQVWKFLPQPVAGHTLDPVHHLPRSQCRRDLGEQVDMIWLHGEIQYPTAERPDDLRDERLQTFSHRSSQNRTPVLWAEYEVIPDFVGGMPCVRSFDSHERIISHAVNEYKGRTSSLRLAPFPHPLQSGCPQGA